MSSTKKAFFASVVLVAICVLIVICFAQAEEFNGTTYKLSLSDIQVTQPINGSSFNITSHEKTDNISLLSPDGRETIVNSTYSFWRGENIYRVDFESPVKGELVYTIPHLGQELVLPLQDNSSIRIILPPDYTTGNHILGIARPNSDNVTIIGNVTTLTWINPKGPAIYVDYYKINAPTALLRIIALLGIMATILLIEYYLSIRKLRAISKEVEKDV